MKLSWLPLAFIALFSNGLAIFLITVATKRNISVPVALFTVTCVLATVFGLQIFQQHTPLRMPFSSLAILVVAGLIAVVGNYTLYEAAHLAPSPGLATAINSTSTVFITLLAYIFFRDTISIYQIIGIIITITGITIISLGK